MENKRNEATLNRPEGDRVLDAPYVFINIPEFIRQLKNERNEGKYHRIIYLNIIFRYSFFSIILVYLPE